MVDGISKNKFKFRCLPIKRQLLQLNNEQCITIYFSLSKSFWKRWVKKRQGNVSMNTALNCTRDMAINHIAVMNWQRS